MTYDVPMPQRATNQSVSSSVGKMIFHGQSAKRIEHRLKTVDQGKMKDLLVHRGLSKDTSEMAKVLSGEHRSGWSPAKLRSAVEVLQEVGLARKAKTAHEMVLTASRTAQAAANPGLSALAVKRRLKGLAVERRAEAGTDTQSTGVLDNMRGAAGRANAVNREQGAESSTEEPANKSVREMREEIRQEMKLQPRLDVSKNSQKKDGFGFQA